jgi:hypothetical protein
MRVLITACLAVAACYSGSIQAQNSKSPTRAELVSQGTPAEARTGNDRLASQVPVFGGAYWDGDGTFVVFLTDTSHADAYNEIFKRELYRIGKPDSPIRLRHGDYAWAQLKSFEKKLAQYWSRDVVFGGIDSRVNRYRIELETEEAKMRMIGTIRSLSLPVDAFVVERHESLKSNS